MKFDEINYKNIRIKKINHFLHKNYLMYLNSDYPVFGIVEIHGCWFLIHIPTERPITKSFFQKKDLEEYLEFLNKEMDLNSIFLYNFDSKELEKDIKGYIEIAYCKYIEKKRKDEKNNNI